MKNKELLPCPFCGGQAFLNPHYYDFCVECFFCGAGTSFHHTEEEAIKRWNTRTNTIPVGNGEDYEVVQR